jgi:hypothetical protein
MFNHSLWLAMVWGMLIAALMWAPVGPQYSFSVTPPPAVLLVADSATGIVKVGEYSLNFGAKPVCTGTQNQSLRGWQMPIPGPEMD